MAHDIRVRQVPFEFEGRVEPIWHPTAHEWAHMVNGASLTMPYLEPFLNRTMREARSHIDDEDLLEDIDGFVRQEAQHFQNHRKFNEELKTNGYSELASVEATYEADYKDIEKLSLAKRLAYSAGFETMTMGVTEWLINDRDELFQGADPIVVSMVLWHMVEETEHKSVAFDVFQSISGSYWLRVYGLLYGSLHVGFMSRRAYMAMLKKDGLWGRLSSRIRVWMMVGRFFLKAGPAMLRALVPSYHPDKISDPSWVEEWRQKYEELDKKRVPLLNTTAPGIPANF